MIPLRDMLHFAFLGFFLVLFISGLLGLLLDWFDRRKEDRKGGN